MKPARKEGLRKWAVFIAVSVTVKEAARLSADGPRRDFLELASATGGRVLYQDAPAVRGVRGRLWGPHIRQALALAKAARAGDRVFADGEHVGIPLLLFLAALRRHGVRVVMLGHFVDKPWKLGPLRLLTRCIPGGAIVVHSLRQRDALASKIAKNWRVEAIPYQVDTPFWSMQGVAPDADLAAVLAVGSEHRDYETLAEAVRDLPARVLIAAGSHWARETASTRSLPPNVRYTPAPLNFRQLRDAYERCALVVVPLTDVTNQSGITTLLEAMSMGRPVITTANRGQRECVSGPMVTASGPQHDQITDRGPHLLTPGAPQDTTGLYVPVGDARALCAAIAWLLKNPQKAREMGAAGRRVAEAAFSLESFTCRLAAIVLEEPALDRPSVEVAAIAAAR